MLGVKLPGCSLVALRCAACTVRLQTHMLQTDMQRWAQRRSRRARSELSAKHIAADSSTVFGPYPCPAGRIYMNPNLPDLSSHDRSRVYSRLAKTLADLHSLNPAQLGLEGFGNPTHYCRRQVCLLAVHMMPFHACLRAGAPARTPALCDLALCLCSAYTGRVLGALPHA